MGVTHQRLNIYLDQPGLRDRIKVAAAQRGVTASAYCLEAILRRLTEDGRTGISQRKRATVAARKLDQLRQKIGPIGIPVRELIAEGRR